jgi:hypothetical protein
VFWDSVDPSEAANQVLADAFIEQGETCILLNKILEISLYFVQVYWFFLREFCSSVCVPNLFSFISLIC